MLSKETTEILQELYRTIANGNEDAYRFVVGWQAHSHSVDDIIDGEAKSPEQIIASFFSLTVIHQSNYWIKNREYLYITVALVTSDYADSNIKDMPQADFLRSTGNNLLKAVAFLEGGYSLLRKVSPIINRLSYKEHHDLTTGKGI